MLTESFVASVSAAEKTSKKDSIIKDAGIYLYEYQPLPTLRSSFKKSSTQPNCLAVGVSHVFAAQSDKAVVHVYSRERSNQESTIPFPEKICSVALLGGADGGGALAMGTEGGRVILWELCTGRQVSTPQSHLQATTCLVADPTYNFLLSGSPDSNIHVWSIPGLLSFSSSTSNDPSQPSPFSPQNTLSNHRAEVTTLVIGHSSSNTNIAISGSRDSTCIVWNYRSGDLLHTFLLPSAPLCLALDPADRAFYAGYEDGSIQLVDFYTQTSLSHPIHDPALQATPTQPPPSSRWPIQAEEVSAALCISVSYDGLGLISGHRNGKVHTWNVATGQNGTPLTEFFAPITNIQLLHPTGFPNAKTSPLKLASVVKPRYESSLNSSENNASGILMIDNYNLTAKLMSMLPLPPFSSTGTSDTLLAEFDDFLSHLSFPSHLLEEGIATFATAGTTDARASLDTTSSLNESQTLEISTLKAQLSQARAAQQAYTDKALELNAKVLMLYEERKVRETDKRRRRLQKAKEAELRRQEIMANGEVAKEAPIREHGSKMDTAVEEDLSSNMDETDDE